MSTASLARVVEWWWHGEYGIYIEQVAGQQVQVVPVLVAPTRPAATAPLYNCSQVDSSDISVGIWTSHSGDTAMLSATQLNTPPFPFDTRRRGDQDLFGERKPAFIYPEESKDSLHDDGNDSGIGNVFYSLFMLLY